MPFDDNDDSDKQPTRKIGLKKTNSSMERKNTAEIRENFEKQADGKFSQIEDYKSKMWDLSIKYKSFIENKTLPENKGPIASNLEKEVLGKLVELAIIMNEDEMQEQGMGSTALCMLLMKSMLIQRDTINILSSKIEQLEKKVLNFEKK